MAETAIASVDRHARVLVQLVVARHAIDDGDIAAGVGALHARLSRLLYSISLEHGSDAMATAAQYAVSALDAGSLYPGSELESFIGQVAASVRMTAKDLTRSTPFGT